MFGMHSSTGDQEVFALEDEEAAALWDLDELEVERLRAAGSQQLNSSGVSGLLGLTPGVEGPHGESKGDFCRWLVVVSLLLRAMS